MDDFHTAVASCKDSGKLRYCKWNPVASGILATGLYGDYVSVWNVE